MNASVLVIGVGNAEAGDDAAGVAAVRRLRGRVPARVTLIEASGDLTPLLETWRPAAAVVIVDAMRSGARAGTVRRFDAAATPLPARAFRAASSHTFGVAEVVELARALGGLPARLAVYGIEGACFESGCALTPEVDAGVRDVVERVLGEVRTTALP